MAAVTSKDGTKIAFDRVGSGQPLILVDGAMCRRSFGPMQPLSQCLSPHFTVFLYDRRGRDESGDTLPYAVEREIEDIHALIQEAGGSAFVYGTSSGAVLAMLAAAHGLNIRKLAMYEPPLNSDATEQFQAYKAKLEDVLSAERKGDAIEAFMTYVGTPPEALAGMRHAPMWPMLEAVGHTLAYDAALMGDGSVPTALAATVKMPTLVMTGGATFPFMHTTAHALVAAMPNAEYRQIEGQTHDVAPDAIAPVLVEFFNQ